MKCNNCRFYDAKEQICRKAARGLFGMMDTECLLRYLININNSIYDLLQSWDEENEEETEN